MKEILISPSVLSADFCNMAGEVERMETAGADMLHLDVMDGVFVPNISFGPQMVKEIRKHTGLPLDVHLMITRPERYVSTFVGCGADYVTVHYEATSSLRYTLEAIRSLGAKSGVVISPDTPASAVFPYLDFADMVLVMSVYPGFGGQKFIPESLDKLQLLAAEINRRGLNIRLEVDGGINVENAADVISAGADTLVAGSAIFGASNAREAIDKLRDPLK